MILCAANVLAHKAIIVINALLAEKMIGLVYLKTLSIAKTLALVTVMRKIINANVSTIYYDLILYQLVILFAANALAQKAIIVLHVLLE